MNKAEKILITDRLDSVQDGLEADVAEFLQRLKDGKDTKFFNYHFSNEAFRKIRETIKSL
jgi:hypothetical protein